MLCHAITPLRADANDISTPMRDAMPPPLMLRVIVAPPLFACRCFREYMPRCCHALRHMFFAADTMSRYAICREATPLRLIFADMPALLR